MRFRRDAIGGLPQMPPLRGSGCFGRGAFYKDVAPTALDLCWMRRVLQRCRAYGARFVLDATGSTEMPRLTGLGVSGKTVRAHPASRAPEVRHPCSRAPQTHPKFYTDAAPTGLGMFRTWRVLQRCRAYGARFVLDATGSTELPRLRRLGCRAKRFEPDKRWRIGIGACCGRRFEPGTSGSPSTGGATSL